MIKLLNYLLINNYYQIICYWCLSTIKDGENEVIYFYINIIIRYINTIMMLFIKKDKYSYKPYYVKLYYEKQSKLFYVYFLQINN